MSGLYNPKIDLVFRKLFGSEQNKQLLISLINSIVAPDPTVADVVIKNPYNLADYIGSKSTILDIKAVDQAGVWYDIEMQIAGQTFYGKRATYYAAKVFVDQLIEEGRFSQLNKTIGIHLIDFDYFNDERYVRQFVFKDKQTNEEHPHLDCLALYFIEMRKAKGASGVLASKLDRWLKFLNEAEALNAAALPAGLSDDQDIVRAITVLERMGFDPQERAAYEAEVKAKMVDIEELDYAIESGMRKGLELGRQSQERSLLRLMARRFGPAPADLMTQLDRLNLSQMEDLAEALLDLNSYSEIAAWIASR